MDCIGCIWFPNIWTQFLEFVWMDFGKELPCRSSFMQLWMSRFSRGQGGGPAEGADGVRFIRITSVETTFCSSFCNIAMFHEKYYNSLLGSLVKSADKLILLGVSHRVPSAWSWSGCVLIRISFSQAGTMPWTDFSTSSVPLSVGKTSSCLGHLPLATLYLN